jgi:hypothetical protein
VQDSQPAVWSSAKLRWRTVFCCEYWIACLVACLVCCNIWYKETRPVTLATSIAEHSTLLCDSLCAETLYRCDRKYDSNTSLFTALWYRLLVELARCADLNSLPGNIRSISVTRPRPLPYRIFCIYSSHRQRPVTPSIHLIILSSVELSIHKTIPA